jgi:hypothetical protein
MEIYLSASEISFNGINTPISSVIPSLNIGDVILLNHSTYGSYYNLSGNELTGVIPFDVVCIDHAEFTEEKNQGKKNITLMSKNILRYSIFDFNIDENNLPAFGENIWPSSTLEQYLNSTNQSGVLNESLDLVPSSKFLNVSKNCSYLYADEPGFLGGFDDFIRDIIPSVNIKSAKNDFNSKYSIGDKAYLNELISEKSRCENQFNYNNSLLDIYESETSRGILTMELSSGISGLNNKIKQCIDCKDAISNLQKYLSGTCKKDVITCENEILSSLTSYFNEIIENFNDIENFYNNDHSNYSKLDINVSSIISNIDNIFNKIISIDDKLNEKLSGFNELDFMNYRFIIEYFNRLYFVNFTKY